MPLLPHDDSALPENMAPPANDSWESADGYLAAASIDDAMCPPEGVVALRRQFDSVRDHWLSVDGETLRARVSSAIDRGVPVQPQPVADRHNVAESHRFPLGRKRYVRWGSAAAFAAVLILFVLYRAGTPSYAPATETFATAAGEIKRITLADGSRVTLAPATRLTLAPKYNEASRTATLEGEALFEVTASNHLPFTVRTGTVATRVLGTSFAVRRYSGQDTAQVIVLSGKVEVGARRHVVASPGMIARVTDSSATATPISPAKASAATDWTNGRLVFDGARVEEMLATISRWYGYEFVLTDSVLAKREVSTTVSASDAEETIVMIKSLLNVNATVQSRIVTLSPKHALSNRSPRLPARLQSQKPVMEVGR